MDPVRAVGFDPHFLLLEADFSRLAPHQVYAAFTAPELLVQWWPTSAEADAQIGGEYHFSWPQMSWSLRGEYTEVDPPDVPDEDKSDVIPMSGYRSSAAISRSGGGRLAFSWSWDHEPGSPPRAVTLAFEPHGDGTRVSLRHGNYGLSDAEQEVRRSHQEGWEHFLPALANVEFG